MLPIIKKITIWGLLIIVLTACSNSSTTPDLATPISGVYVLEYLNLAGTEMTAEFMMMVGGTSAINVEKKDATSITLHLKVTVRGNTSEVHKNLTLSDAGSGATNLLENGKRIGTYSNNKIDISSTTNDGGVFNLTANKN